MCGEPGGRRAIVWKDGKLNSSTFAESSKCIIIDWDTGSARDSAGARTDGRTLRAWSTFSFAPMTETRSIDGGLVDFWSLRKAKVFRFPFCSALAHFPLSLALTGSPACLPACLPDY